VERSSIGPARLIMQEEIDAIRRDPRFRDPHNGRAELLLDLQLTIGNERGARLFDLAVEQEWRDFLNEG
jgi:hypothetical protein